MSPDHFQVPNFLVIGAQKSGTTTLWEDLRTHPDVALADKESNGLLDDDVTSPAGQRKYSSIFPSGKGLVRGEVCTTYSMLPDHEGVVKRAFTLNPDMRIVYIVREPLSRVVSHHHHDFGLGLCDSDIDVEVHRHPELINNSRYGTQLKPWVETFGRENVLVIKFEDYIHDREGGLNTLHHFLGLRPAPLVSQEVHNSSQGKRVVRGGWIEISESTLYRRLIRPLMPEGLRRRLMAMVLPVGPDRPAPPSQATVDFMTSTLEPEVRVLADLTQSEQLWDLEQSPVARRADL